MSITLIIVEQLLNSDEIKNYVLKQFVVEYIMKEQIIFHFKFTVSNYNSSSGYYKFLKNKLFFLHNFVQVNLSELN